MPRFPGLTPQGSTSSLRRIFSFGTTPPPDPYAQLRALLQTTIGDDGAPWRVLTEAWLGALSDEEQNEVLEWARRVSAVRHGTARHNPHVPRFLQYALSPARRLSNPAGMDAGGPAGAQARADKTLADTMLEINKLAQEKSGTAAHSLGVRPYGRREIGHRMAQIYGTTKREWEAGRSWQ